MVAYSPASFPGRRPPRFPSVSGTTWLVVLPPPSLPPPPSPFAATWSLMGSVLAVAFVCVHCVRSRVFLFASSVAVAAALPAHSYISATMADAVDYQTMEDVERWLAAVPPPLQLPPPFQLDLSKLKDLTATKSSTVGQFRSVIVAGSITS